MVIFAVNNQVGYLPIGKQLIQNKLSKWKSKPSQSKKYARLYLLI